MHGGSQRGKASRSWTFRPGWFPTSCRKNHGLPRTIELYELWIRESAQASLLPEVGQTLQGKNLGYWCPIGALCHADALLWLVNA